MSFLPSLWLEWFLVPVVIPERIGRHCGEFPFASLFYKQRSVRVLVTAGEGITLRIDKRYLHNGFIIIDFCCTHIYTHIPRIHGAVEKGLAELLVCWLVFKIRKITICLLIILIDHCQHVVMRHTFGGIICNVITLILSDKEQAESNDNQYADANENTCEKAILFHGITSEVCCHCIVFVI